MTEEDPQRLDLLDELDAVLDLGRRAPGSDAERRTANHLRDRLAALGRDAEVESFAIYPAWPLAYVLLAAAAVGASVLSVYVPVAGAALALAAALLTFLDAGVLVPVARRLFGRRASQNVVSFDTAGRPGAVVLVAHLDAGRAGPRPRRPHGPAPRRPRPGAAASGRRPRASLFWAELAVLACTLLRLAGIDSTALTVVQFVPTLALIVAIALLTDVALAGTKAGENDNASGAVTAARPRRRPSRARPLRPPRPLHRRPEGRRRRHARLPQAPRPSPRQHRRRERRPGRVGRGPLHAPRGRAGHPALTPAARRRSPREDESVAAIVNRTASDGHAATAAGYAAITVTCRDGFDYASGRVDEQALEAAERFCAELLERLDAEVGPSIAAPVDATALSEPEAG